MSDPFAVEVPAWLQNAARPWDSREFADAVGTALGGGLKMLFDKQPVLDKQGKPVIDPDTGQPETKHPGLFEAIGEARMNQADPMWRLKAKALETNVMGQQARAAETWQNFQLNQKEFAAKAKDLKTFPDQLEKLKTDPYATPDTPFESTWAQQQWDNVSKSAQMGALRKQQIENQTTTAKITVENAKAFNKQLATVKDPADAQRIIALTQNGMPTEAAWQALSAAPKVEAPTVQAAEIRVKGNIAAEEQKQKNRKELIEIKEENREKFAKVAQENRIELAKITAELRKNLKVRDIERETFVDNYTDTIYQSIRKQDPDMPPAKAYSLAQDMLRNEYDDISAREKKLTAPKPAAPSGAPAATNAPAKATRRWNPVTQELEPVP